MISIHGILTVEVNHSGKLVTDTHWVEVHITTNEGSSRLTLYSNSSHVTRVAAGLREMADALEGRALPVPEGVVVLSPDDPEKLHQALDSIFGEDQ